MIAPKMVFTGPQPFLAMYIHQIEALARRSFQTGVIVGVGVSLRNDVNMYLYYVAS